MLGRHLAGLALPAAGPVFTAALGVHVLAGLTCVTAGASAAIARKAPPRHPRAGRIYLAGLVVLFLTATVMSALRWPRDRSLFLLGSLAVVLAGTGWLARRRRRPGWVRWHIVGMGTSYIVVLTAFYVDNGPLLPVWNRLPGWAFWVLPAAVGGPILVRALWRRPGGRITPAPRGRPRTPPPRLPRGRAGSH